MSSFIFLDMFFPSTYDVPLSLFFCMESTLYVFFPDGVFLPCDHGLDFAIMASAGCIDNFNNFVRR